MVVSLTSRLESNKEEEPLVAALCNESIPLSSNQFLFLEEEATNQFLFL